MSDEPRTADAIEAEMAQTREHLVATLAQIKAEVTPAALAARGSKAVTGIFVDEYGGIRTKRVAIIVGVTVAVVGLKILGSRRGRSH